MLGLANANPLLVAERLCADVDQTEACFSRPVFSETDEKNAANEGGACHLWPNPAIPLPNVTGEILNVVNGFNFLNCLPETRFAVCSGY